mmetsp:Transcript_8268/g.31087  ORF Transcript_8268/g.31087 Transcript_8268/m.31087 type:complete len:230 (-) Transcript_8268:82-771(-)
MHRLFGRKKEEKPAPSLSDAQGRLTEREGNLDKKIASLDAELRKYKAQMAKARGPAKANIRRRAAQVLKRKKMYEQQRDHTAAQAFNVDQTAFAIDSAKDNITTVEAMKAATTTLKTEYAKINIGEIEDVTDDLADMFEDLEEVNEALGRNYNVDELDDADIDAELDALGDDIFDEELGEEEATPSFLAPAGLPVEPTGVLPAQPQPAQPATAEEKVDEFGLPIAPQAS